MARIKAKGMNATAIAKLLGDKNAFWDNGYIYSEKYTQQELDQIKEDYDNNKDKYLLEPQRKNKTDMLSEKAADFINSRYPVHKQQMLQALLTEAVFESKQNRANYIKRLLNWTKSVVAYISAVEQQVASADTFQEIASIQASFEAFEETDPEITISEALQIED
jgi:hypothetical protein